MKSRSELNEYSDCALHQVLLLPSLLPEAAQLDGLQAGQEAPGSAVLCGRQTAM